MDLLCKAITAQKMKESLMENFFFYAGYYFVYIRPSTFNKATIMTVVLIIIITIIKVYQRRWKMENAIESNSYTCTDTYA